MLKKYQIKFLALVSILFLVGCASGVTIKDQPQSLSELTSIALANLPAGHRKTSQNGREFFSKPFIHSKEGEFVEAGSNVTTRYTAHITILGDRRPYDINIEVITEKRARDGKYDQVGYDEGLARVISRRFEKALHQRREDRNMIDDFKVF